jgi:hypothetical protein
MDEHQEDDRAKNSIDEVRQRALDALAPIINDLHDIDPEKRFEISLSALRYVGDGALANSALEAALAIKSTGAKAEALVELINELNYIQQA